MSLPGTFQAARKDGAIYYRASFTYRNKHISLGSFDTEEAASMAYLEARMVTGSISCEELGLLTSSDRHIPEPGGCTIDDYSDVCTCLAFDKYVVLINFRDKGIYIKTPIYLMNHFFIYYLSEAEPLKFDVDDLFYYSNHAIMRRNGYLFVADYGMQINILSRYGIRNHAVKGRDYEFINGDDMDYRYGNLSIINRYFGVERISRNGREYYRTRIHINGNYIVGTYNTENEAAIAYNKAVTLLREKGVTTAYTENYLEDVSAVEYAKIYNKAKISKKLREYIASL